jgi:hypothetical protein
MKTEPKPLQYVRGVVGTIQIAGTPAQLLQMSKIFEYLCKQVNAHIINTQFNKFQFVIQQTTQTKAFNDAVIYCFFLQMIAGYQHIHLTVGLSFGELVSRGVSFNGQQLVVWQGDAILRSEDIAISLIDGMAVDTKAFFNQKPDKSYQYQSVEQYITLDITTLNKTEYKTPYCKLKIDPDISKYIYKLFAQKLDSDEFMKTLDELDSLSNISSLSNEYGDDTSKQ